MTAPAVVSWAARLGWLNLEGTPLAFLGAAVTPWIFTLAAVGEIVNDKLAKTGSRKAPPQLIARLIMGGLSGAAIGAAGQQLPIGLVAGVLGAAAGTFGGFALRARLAQAFGKDFPAALLEDVVAIALAFFSVTRFH
jgi:uncharacterized membrane protein